VIEEALKKNMGTREAHDQMRLATHLVARTSARAHWCALRPILNC